MKDWLRNLTRLAALLAALGTVFLMLATVADVGRRQTIGQPIAGAIEISEVVLVAVVFLGVAYAQRKKQHVATTVLTDRLPPLVSGWLRTLAYAIAVFVVAWMIKATGEVAFDSYQRAEYRFGVTKVPIWPARVAIPVGLTLLVGELVRDLALNIRSLRRGQPPPGEGDVDALDPADNLGLPE